MRNLPYLGGGRGAKSGQLQIAGGVSIRLPQTHLAPFQEDEREQAMSNPHRTTNPTWLQNLLRVLAESQVKAALPDGDLRLLLATVKEGRVGRTVVIPAALSDASHLATMYTQRGAEYPECGNKTCGTFP